MDRPEGDRASYERHRRAIYCHRAIDHVRTLWLRNVRLSTLTTFPCQIDSRWRSIRNGMEADDKNDGDKFFRWTHCFIRLDFYRIDVQMYSEASQC